MSITSLTAVASGGITNLTSGFIFADINGVGYSVPLDVIEDLGLGYYGAMQTIPNSGTILGITIATTTTIVYSEEIYNFGDWIDSNSLGVFRVPNDDWEYVTCQAGIYSHMADWARLSIISGAPGSESKPVGGGEYLMDDLPSGSGWGVTIESAPIAVSSGDVVKCVFYSSTANSIQNFATWGQFFAIQGYKRAI